MTDEQLEECGKWIRFVRSEHRIFTGKEPPPGKIWEVAEQLVIEIDRRGAQIKAVAAGAVESNAIIMREMSTVTRERDEACKRAVDAERRLEETFDHERKRWHKRAKHAEDRVLEAEREMLSLRSRLAEAEKRVAYYESVLTLPEGALVVLEGGVTTKAIEPTRVADLVARLAEVEAERDALLVEECSLEDCGAQRIEDEAFTCTNCYAAAAQGRERAETRLAELEAERDEWRSVVEVPAYFGDPQAARGYVRGLISHHAEHHEREEKAAARLAESQAREARLRAALERCSDEMRGGPFSTDLSPVWISAALAASPSEALDAIRRIQRVAEDDGSFPADEWRDAFAALARIFGGI